MATTTLVNNIFEEGKEFLKYLDSMNLNIKAAFWFYQKENSSWKLILSSPLVARTGSRSFYSRVFTNLKKFNSESFISPLDIVVLPYSDNLISTFRKIIKTGPAPSISSIRLTNNVVDGVQIEDALVYRLT
jgi:hypothetical protein